MTPRRTISVTVNGNLHTAEVPVRLLLSDFLRGDLGLTGTHIGCEHGVCGCCTVLLENRPVRSCLMFAVQASGHDIATVEGLRAEGQALHPLQEAFHQEHALQCGFCTSGMLMTLVPFLQENPRPSPEQIREALSGNLCRCTGYVNIVKAVQRATGQTP
jgi:carbon-monoxide dehydrogenase small subunit